MPVHISASECDETQPHRIFFRQINLSFDLRKLSIIYLFLLVLLFLTFHGVFTSCSPAKNAAAPSISVKEIVTIIRCIFTTTAQTFKTSISYFGGNSGNNINKKMLTFFLVMQ